MPKQIIDKEKLIDQAYAIAAREGISALSVRPQYSRDSLARHSSRSVARSTGARVSLTTCGNCAVL